MYFGYYDRLASDKASINIHIDLKNIVVVRFFVKRPNNFHVITDLMDLINFAILFSYFDTRIHFFSDRTMEEFSPAGDGKWNTIDTVKSAFKFVQAIAF